MGVNADRLRGRRWRLVFNMDDPQAMRVISVSKRDRGSVADAVTLLRAAIRHAMDQGGCRSVTVGVHIEGEDCDHDVGPG